MVGSAVQQDSLTLDATSTDAIQRTKDGIRNDVGTLLHGQGTVVILEAAVIWQHRCYGGI